VQIARAVAAIAGLLLLATGLWALIDPRSFFDIVATYPPYNEHFLHDIGAFNLGLAAVLLLALVWSDALLVGLTGVGIGAASHALAHWLDMHLGGTPSDPWLLSAFAAVILVGAALRWREIRR
jgi:hypothetical protein